MVTDPVVQVHKIFYCFVESQVHEIIFSQQKYAIPSSQFTPFRTL